jgi:hypothetical protein
MQQRSKTAQRLAYVFGISMAVLMAASLVMPALTPDTTTTPQELQPTASPAPPTFPPPLENFDGIVLEDDYLHPSGLFAIGLPTGFQATNVTNDATRALVNLNNQTTASSILIGVERPMEEMPTTVSAIEDYYTQARLQQGLTQYANWTELGRASTEDAALIDLALIDRQQRGLRARQAAFTDGDWLYTVRVVTPEDATGYQFHLVDLMLESFKVNAQYIDSPLGWLSTFDPVNQWLLRHPRTWQVVDGGDGLPTSIVTANDVQIRVETLPGTAVDQAAARAYVEDLRPDLTVNSIEPIERANGSGFQVSYRFENFDGAARSGVTLLLNGATGSLYILDAIIPQADVDANAGLEGIYNDLGTALESFDLITGLTLPEPEPQPTPTPFPEPAEADDADDAETTPEATEEATDDE